MTVCIAALCDNGNGCILTSDQMITAHFPIGYEFENQEIDKIVKITDNAWVLIAGDVLFANEIIKITKQRVNIENIQSTQRIADILRESYQLVRKLRIIRNELEPRGLDLNSYLTLQQKLFPSLVQIIDQAFIKYNAGVEFILAGKDDSACHIYTVINPGDMICHDPIGFVAIGSGGPHALYSLIEADYKKSLSKEAVKDFIEKAKKRSEVAPGVGNITKTIEI